MTKYSKLRECLREEIVSNKYKSLDKIPSESELIEMYGVSRITVRRALNELQNEGLIFKMQGKGVYVSRKKATQNVTVLRGFGEAMSLNGYTIYNEILDIELESPNKMVEDKLKLDRGEHSYMIRRKRFLSGSPISLDITHVPIDIGVKLNKIDLANRDIFTIMENDLGIDIINADLLIGASRSSDDIAEIIGVDKDDPVFNIERTTYTNMNKPISFEKLYYIADKFQYELSIRRERQE